MTLQRFAEDYRLRIKRDKCGDPVIQGRLGQIYVDNGKVCAMWIDAPCMKRARLEQLGGKLWIGDYSVTLRGKRIQDVKIEGISEAGYKAVIGLTKTRTRQVYSAERLEVLKANLAGTKASRKPAKDSARVDPEIVRWVQGEGNLPPGTRQTKIGPF